MLSSQDTHKIITESAIAWWRDAGVDYVCGDETVNWLADAPPISVAEKAPVQVTARPAQISAPAKTIAPITAWPNDLAALKAAMTDGSALPGCQYGPRCVAPIGETGAVVIVIVDCPEEDEIAAGHFGVGPVAALQKNMLLAANIVPDLTYYTALSFSRPATGSLPKDDLPNLASFALHQIALVQPAIVILFGSAACEAMLSQELMKTRGNLDYINHNDRKTAAVATFHPRTLLAQPQLKTQAWKDLQMLMRKDYL